MDAWFDAKRDIIEAMGGKLIYEIKEPFIKTNIFVPSDYIGPIMELCQDKRGDYIGMEYIDPTRVNIHYELPLSEIVYDFFDKLKSYTKGYASFDYELSDYKVSDLLEEYFVSTDISPLTSFLRSIFRSLPHVPCR